MEPFDAHRRIKDGKPLALHVGKAVDISARNEAFPRTPVLHAARLAGKPMLANGKKQQQENSNQTNPN